MPSPLTHSPNPTITLTLLPHSDPSPTLWTRLVTNTKALRLTSLQHSPTAFSSTYEREVAFTTQQWDARLRNPLAYTFVATTNPDSFDMADIRIENGTFEDIVMVAEAEWLASVVLVGPLGWSDADAHRSDINPVDEEKTNTSTFSINALFVLPTARGHGLGKALVEAAIAHAVFLTKAKGANEVVVEISSSAGNVEALGLYARLGFKRVETCTGAEQMKGDKDTVDMEMRVSVS